MFNFLGLLSFFSPPFLAFFAWKKFLEPSNAHEKHRWKALVDWIALLSVSGLFVVCVVAFLTIPCDVGLYGWACVAKWRRFSGYVVRTTPIFVLLAAIGKKGTRILSVLWVLAINFDCLMVDMMA
jgi:hypothetical protein